MTNISNTFRLLLYYLLPRPFEWNLSLHWQAPVLYHQMLGQANTVRDMV